MKVKLMTKELERAFQKYPLYSQDGRGGDAVVVAKYFVMGGRGTWYITEGSPQGADWMLYGYVDLGFPEWGYVALSQLEELGYRIERDVHFPVARITVRDACRMDGVPFGTYNAKPKANANRTVLPAPGGGYISLANSYSAKPRKGILRRRRRWPGRGRTSGSAWSAGTGRPSAR